MFIGGFLTLFNYIPNMFVVWSVPAKSKNPGRHPRLTLPGLVGRRQAGPPCARLLHFQTTRRSRQAERPDVSVGIANSAAAYGERNAQGSAPCSGAPRAPRPLPAPPARARFAGRSPGRARGADRVGTRLRAAPPSAWIASETLLVRIGPTPTPGEAERRRPRPPGGDRATGPRRRRAPCAAGFPRAGGARCPRTRFPRDRAEPAAGEGRARGGRSSRPVSRAARGSPALAGGGVRGSSSDTGRQRCGARVPAQRLRPAPTTARDARAADSRRRRVPGLEQVTQE